MRRPHTFFGRHRRTIFGLLFLVLFGITVTYAVPPSSPYLPGETLDPNCAPGDSNCLVQIIPAQTGNSGKFLTTDGSSIGWASVASGGSWGTISGTLSNQTDLQTALNAKADAVRTITINGVVQDLTANRTFTTEVPLTFSTGLTRSTNTVTNNLSTGVAGGQDVVGGTAPAESLTLVSTANGTKGKILFGTSAYDEANNRLGVGTPSPTVALDVTGGVKISTLTGTGNRLLQAAATGDVGASNVDPQEVTDVFTITGAQNTLISGGVVSWVTGLTFDVSAADYYIQGDRYQAPATQVTLASADVNFDRIDVFAVDTTGSVVVIQGTPSATPTEPEIDSTKYLRLSFAYVPATAVAPQNVSAEYIYQENTEWTTSTNQPSIVDFNYATAPHTGSKSVRFSQWLSGAQATFVRSSSTTLTGTTLVFYIKTSAPWGSNSRKLSLQWLTGGTAASNSITMRDGVFGFSESTTGWQKIAIPISQWTLSSQSADRLRITEGNNSTTSFSLQFDDIQLQGGVSNTAPTQNTFLTVQGNTGTYSAQTTKDTLRLLGANSISTAQSANTLNITLAGDVASPGNSQYYGTDGNGTKGWFGLPNGAPSLTNTYIGFGNGSNQLTGSNNFTFDSSNNVLQIKYISGAGGTDPRFILDATFGGTNFIVFKQATVNQWAVGHVADFIINRYNSSGVFQNSALTINQSTGKWKLGSYGSGSQTGTAAYNLAVDSSGNVIEVLAGGSTPGIDSVLAVGQALTSNRTLNTGTNLLSISGSSGSYALDVSNANIAINASGTNGPGITAQSINDSAGSFVVLPASTNINQTILLLTRGTTNTAANNESGSIDIQMETSTGSNHLSNQLISAWTNATDASRTSQFSITGVNNAVTANILTLAGTGALKLNAYGSGTFTGTTAYGLAVDSSGNVIEASGLVTTAGVIGSVPNANGASISGSTLTLQPASDTYGGVVTTGAQNFKGNKNFIAGSASTAGYEFLTSGFGTIMVLSTTGNAADGFVGIARNPEPLYDLAINQRLYVGTNLKLASYGLGNITGTAAYNLAVDASGNVIEVPGGGGTPTLQQVLTAGSTTTLDNTIITTGHNFKIQNLSGGTNVMELRNRDAGFESYASLATGNVLLSSADYPSYNVQSVIEAAGGSNAIYLYVSDSPNSLRHNLYIFKDQIIINGGGNTLNLKLQGLAAETASQDALCITSGDVVQRNTGSQTCTVSSARFKHDITPLPMGALETIDQLVPSTFVYNGQTNTRIGLIAEDVNKVEPTLVFYDEDGVTPRGVRYEDLAALSVKGIQELDLKINSITDLTNDADGSFVNQLRAWFANASNHITRIFTGEICLTDPDGSSECLSKTELTQLKQMIHNNAASATPPASTTNTSTTTTTPPPTTTDATSNTTTETQTTNTTTTQTTTTPTDSQTSNQTTVPTDSSTTTTDSQSVGAVGNTAQPSSNDAPTQ